MLVVDCVIVVQFLSMIHASAIVMFQIVAQYCHNRVLIFMHKFHSFNFCIIAMIVIGSHACQFGGKKNEVDRPRAVYLGFCVNAGNTTKI